MSYTLIDEFLSAGLCHYFFGKKSKGSVFLPSNSAATEARFITPSHDHSAPTAPPAHPAN